MKLRHAAAVALAGWFLMISQGVAGVEFYFVGGPPYQTKADCEKAGQEFIRRVYAQARKEGERVTGPPSFNCTERKSSK